MIRIAHLSTAHGRGEVRVHLKECNSLAAAGYEVHYIVADGLGAKRFDGVEVHDIGACGGRFQRMLLRPWKMLWAARKLEARIYHFHDPEILLIALFLRLRGADVIYDSHEDVPRSLMSRAWIPRPMRAILSFVFERFENFVARRISAVVGATPHIAARFFNLNKRSIDVNNYPLLSEIGQSVDRTERGRVVCYLGGIGRVRGIEEMIRALEYTDARLILAGPFESAETERQMRNLPGWKKVDYRGKVSRASVREIMAISSAGLVLFHPEPNHVDAQPNKLFEYMSAGLPVIGSDFPLWRDLIQKNDCGVCVDPLNPIEIAEAINALLDDPDAAGRLGRNGREIVLSKCNWSKEEEKLFHLYRSLLRA